MDRTALPHTAGWSLFKLALEARYHYALMGVLLDCDKISSKEFDHYRSMAGHLSCLAGERFPDEPIPLLLSDDEELKECWKAGRDAVLEERSQLERLVVRQAEAVRIEQLLQARDWGSLGLPTPEALQADLAAGKVREFEGHKLHPDVDGCWITNPYGIDCALIDIKALDAIEGFLSDMARGEKWGLVPQ